MAPKIKKPAKKGTVSAKVIKKAVKKAKRGRPTKYTKKLADKICSQLSEGDSMRTVCKPTNMPNKSTLFRWIRTIEDFCDQYARAKQESADALTDEMLDISDNATNDWMERQGKDAEGYELNGENIQRSRLRIETRKWLAAKLKPKKYGEKQFIETEDTTLKHRTKEELEDRLAELRSQK